MCWPILPYKRLQCLCGVSGDCIEVRDALVRRAASAHTEVHGGNFCASLVAVLKWLVEARRLRLLQRRVSHAVMVEGCLNIFSNDFAFFRFRFSSRIQRFVHV